MGFSRNVSHAAVIAALAATSLFGGATPAAAAPGMCNFGGSLTMTGAYLNADGWVYCPSNGEVLDAFTRIERRNSDGTWTIVASGPGSYSYACQGSAVNTYHLYHGGHYWFQQAFACS
jgi:hypothetical protein